VFPAAGWDPFPARQQGHPKEMLVLVDKPVIQYGVEEAAASGIDNIVLVTGRGKSSMEDHFDVAFELENLLSNAASSNISTSPEDLSDWPTVLRAAGRAARPGPRGAGGQAPVGDEPFAVVLSDDVIDATPPALKQMIDVFHRVAVRCILVERVPMESVSSYGVIAVDESATLARRLQDRDLVEKPRREDAPSNLAIIGRYILTPDIFPSLERPRATSPARFS
jgi:UTP--glucose-1-phosphate uridylyltransferase